VMVRRVPPKIEPVLGVTLVTVAPTVKGREAASMSPS
jgi:hypothetical protein